MSLVSNSELKVSWICQGFALYLLLIIRFLLNSSQLVQKSARKQIMMKKIIMNRTIPDDHSFCVTTPNPTIVLFIAKSKQLMNLMQMNDLEAVLSLVEELVSYSKMVTPAFDIWDREALFAYTVCWELSFILLKLKTKKILVNQLNFRGVYGLFKQIYSGHQSPCTNKLNCLILMQLLPIFMENYLIRAANVCIQLIKAMKIEMEINNACTLTEETPYFSNTQEVEVQITFMVQVFAFSKKVLDDPGLEYDVRVGDNIFNDLLLEIGVEDYFKMPCIVRNKEEAQNLFDMIKSKLSIYKSFMYKEKILTSDERQLMGLNYWMWYSLDLHYMSYFVMGPKHKTELLVIASEVFDFIMKKFFSPKSLEEFFVSKPQMEIQNHYKVLLEKNVNTYHLLISYAKTSIIQKLPMKDEEKLPLINQLNTYNYSFIKVGTDHLRFMDMTVKSPEWQKGWLLFHLGVSYRSLITNDVEQQKVYLDMSLDYYKRFAQITSCEDFKKNVNAAGQVFVGLTAEEHIARTDQEKFLQTFRIDL